MRPMDGPPAVIRTDPALGFKALTEDTLLNQHRIIIELGRSICFYVTAFRSVRQLLHLVLGPYLTPPPPLSSIVLSKPTPILVK